MLPYQTKYAKIPGTSYKEVYKSAMDTFRPIKNRTKRKPYIKSAYFSRRKIFFEYFWSHLWKSRGYKERTRRLKYFKVSLDLLRYSTYAPETKENAINKNELLHRFAGLTKEKELFYVQVKENKRSGRLHFMSCFPVKVKQK